MVSGFAAARVASVVVGPHRLGRQLVLVDAVVLVAVVEHAERFTPAHIGDGLLDGETPAGP